MIGAPPVATTVRSTLRIHPTTQTPPPALQSPPSGTDAPAPRFQKFLLNLARPQGIDAPSVHEPPNEISRTIATLVIEALENVTIEVDPPVVMLDGGIAFYAFPSGGSVGIKKRLVTVECCNSDSLILIHSDRETGASTAIEVSSFDIRAISESLSDAAAFLNA